MKRIGSALILVCAAFALACDSDDTSSDAGDASSDGATSDSPGTDATKDGGSDALFDAGSSVCSPSSQFQTGTLLPISTSGSDFLGSVTPDELSIAWMTTAGA